MKTYVAAGWFSPEQEKARQEILHALSLTEIEAYSPKEDGLYVPGKMPASKAFTENILEISKADFVIASTEGKDMGTLFECGAAFILNKPIVYYFKTGGKFNLMLSESARAVITNFDHLKDYLKAVDTNQDVVEQSYMGEKE